MHINKWTSTVHFLLYMLPMKLHKTLHVIPESHKRISVFAHLQIIKCAYVDVHTMTVREGLALKHMRTQTHRPQQAHRQTITLQVQHDRGCRLQTVYVHCPFSLTWSLEMKIQRKHDTLDVSLKATSVQLPAKSFSGCFFKQTTLLIIYGASYNGWTDKVESSTLTHKQAGTISYTKVIKPLLSFTSQTDSLL